MMTAINMCLLKILSVLIVMQHSKAYNILFMSPFPAPSHWLWLEHFQNDLLRRGHHLTSVNNFPAKQMHPNLTEIIIDPPLSIPDYLPKENVFQMRFTSDFQNIQMWWYIGLISSEHALKDQKIQKLLIEDETKKFDLVIIEQFFHESFLMFAHKYKCPIVTIGTMGYADNMDHAMGLITPWSIIPHIVLSYTDQMTFTQRAYNLYISLYDAIMRRWIYMPKMQQMALKYFMPHLKGPLPHVRELEQNISLMLINSHRSMDIPRPSMPGLISVGGAHIKPVKPLTQHIKSFMDNAKHGVVYFSLGSYMKSTDMPTESVAIILKAFSQLKQHVLWKYENNSLGDLPSNIMIEKWLPQNDILAHDNIKLFITHGGIFGIQEALYWGVPQLCIPLYGDQHRNTWKAVRAGYARSLIFSKMTVQQLIKNIELLIQDPQYKRKALELSYKFRDNPIHPLDEASYWIEYVIRHKGAMHLKSYGTYMPLYQYLLLDVLFVAFIILILSFYMPWKFYQYIKHFKKRSIEYANSRGKKII